jgi:hypothetical protein
MIDNEVDKHEFTKEEVHSIISVNNIFMMILLKMIKTVGEKRNKSIEASIKFDVCSPEEVEEYSFQIEHYLDNEGVHHAVITLQKENEKVH